MRQSILGFPLTFTADFTNAGELANVSGNVTVLIKVLQPNGATLEIYPETDAEEGTLGNAFFTIVPSVAGIYRAVFFSSASVDESVKIDHCEVGADWLQNLYSKVMAISGVTSVPPQGSVSAYGEALAAETSVRFSIPFMISGLSVAGYTSVVFSVKKSVAEDDDSEALVILHNELGITTHNGEPVEALSTLSEQGSINVASAGPELNIEVSITAMGMNLPASEDNEAYVYELDAWVGGDKVQIAKGDFVLTQSVLRGHSEIV